MTFPVIPPPPCPACKGPRKYGLPVTPGTEGEWHEEDCPAMAMGIPVALTINGTYVGQVMSVPVGEGQDPVAVVGEAIAAYGQALIRFARGEPM